MRVLQTSGLPIRAQECRGIDIDMSAEGTFEQAPRAEITFQPVTANDIDTYLELERRVEGRTYTAAQNHEEATEELSQGPMYFIRLGDKIIGTVSYSRKEDGSVYLNGLAIDPDFQGQGVGRAVMEQFLDQVKDAPRVWLVVHPDNTRAIELYQSFGFSITDRKEDYHGDGEPRIILTRDQSQNFTV